jgi:hypothetical protein
MVESSAARGTVYAVAGSGPLRVTLEELGAERCEATWQDSVVGKALQWRFDVSHPVADRDS